MRTTIYLFAILVFSTNIKSQVNQDSVAITQVIDNLFLGMKTGDSSLVRKSFHPNVKLETIFINKNGETKLKNEDLDKFIIAVGKPHEGEWNEKIISYTIQTDQIMAHVWANYKFYVNELFIHCGVNSFQFVKLNNEWKIIHLIDTRRKQGCD